MKRYVMGAFAVAVTLHAWAWVGAAVAQAGVPGARVESGSDHRAAVRAEAYLSASAIELSDVEFHSDGEMAVVVSCYFTTHQGRDVRGLVTAVLLRSSRSWRLRMHLFDPPHALASGTERFAC